MRTDEDGSKHFEYRLKGREVGAAHVDVYGGIWAYALKNGEKHGLEREWNRDGLLTFESYWEDGREHGTSRQWSEDGRLIGMYRMDHGTGLDLWRCNITWTLSEERNCRDGTFHGFTRWWNEDGKTVFEEHHYQNGQEHGIAREWNTQGRRAGRLRRGFPKYYIMGNQVTRRKYLRACETDPALPLFGERDNRPERALPREYMEQVANGIGPRRSGK